MRCIGYNIVAWKGLAIVFAASRWFLAVQYLIGALFLLSFLWFTHRQLNPTVLFYSRHKRKAGVLLHPISTLFCGFCFLAVYLMPSSSLPLAQGQFILAYGSIILDAVVTFVVGILRSSSHREEGQLFERFGLVTLIIMFVPLSLASHSKGLTLIWE